MEELINEFLEKLMNDIINDLETERYDVEVSCAYSDPTGMLAREYNRANEMLDTCISIIQHRFQEYRRESKEK